MDEGKRRADQEGARLDGSPGEPSPADVTATEILRPTGGDVTVTVDPGGAAAAGHAAVDDGARLRRGASVGRYIVLGPLGAGGMGTVYAAYDPELDRRLALKLLHPALPAPASTPGGGPPRLADGAARLLREAKALARLSHPNVLAVYDAGSVEVGEAAGPGTGGQEVFLACELVEGRTLADWTAAGPHSRREVLRVFEQAGRGLAAAHAAGIVHRDFKPGNVMVGDDGRVRVVDFGLARAAAAIPAGGGAAGPSAGVAATEGGLLAAADLAAGAAAPGPAATRSGAVFGTPAYMAPEQRAGRAAGAAADQYAFCVALWEALCGQRPVLGAAPAEGAESGAEGQRLPPWLRRALLRGLAADPADRHPSMQALLDALAADPARHRWRWLVAAAAVGAAALAGLGVHQAALQRAALCSGGETAMAGVWNGSRRRALRRAFESSGAPYADAAFRASAAALDRWAAGWAALHRQACEATRVTGEQSADLLDLRMECLDRQRRGLDRLLAVAEAPQAPPPDLLAEALGGLPPVARCADTRALLAPVQPPRDAESRRRVGTLRGRLDDAAALLQVGRYDAGIAATEALVDDARQLGYWPLTAEALLLEGRLEERASRGEEAVASLDQAVEAAVAGGHERVAAEALVRLVRVHAYERADHPRARYYAALAGAALDRLSEPAELRAELADHLGRLHFQEGDAETALAEHRRALELRLEAHGPDHPEVASTLLRLANVEAERGALDDAREHAGRAVDLYRGAYGNGHPRLAVGLLSLANVLYRQGDPEAALAADREALEIRRQALGEDHLRTADARLQVANALLALDRVDEAAAAFEEVRRVFAAELGEDHPRVASLLSSLAAVALRRGRGGEALRLYDEALALQERIYGTDHPWVANTLYNLGVAAKDQGVDDFGRLYFERSATIWQSTYGADHPLVAHALTGLGQALLAQSQPAAAVTPLERALAIRLGQDTEPELTANTRFALARALAAGGTAAPGRPRELAEAALMVYRQVGEDERAAEVTAWLEVLSGSSP